MIPAARKENLLARDALLLQRDYLLDAAEMKRRFAFPARKFGAAIQACEIVRVKYRFGANLRVLYKLRCGENLLHIAVRTFSAARGREVYENYLRNAAHYSTDFPVWFDEELQTVFWAFPNDRKISNLRVLTDIPANLQTFSGKNWKQSRLVAYAPEKCATAQCLDETGEVTAYAKVFAGGEGRGIYEIYNYFKEKKLRLPRTLAYSETHRTLLLEAIDGTRLADLRAQNQSEVYKKFGAAIALLHEIAPPANLPLFKRVNLENLPRVFETIKKARPELARQAGRLAEKLLKNFKFADEPKVCLHGDVHPKNAIWQDGQLTLIDLDQVSIGQAACDVGSFLAGLHYKKCTGEIAAKKRVEIAESFLSGYAQIRALPPEKSLRWHTATALFSERAARSISRLRVEGLKHLGEILAASEKILDEDE